VKKRIVWLIAAFVLCANPVFIAFGQAGHGIARLSGTVTDDAGNPIPSAKIGLRFVEPIEHKGQSGYKVTAQESAYFEAATDKKGRWSYNGLATGVWEITARAKGYFPASRKCSVFQLQGNPRVPLQLEKMPEPLTENLTESALLEKANEFFYLKKFDEAVALYGIYLRAHPEFDMVALSIANCYQEKGDLDTAIGRYRTVVERTSKNRLDDYLTAQAYAGIAECYWKKKDIENTKAFYKHALETTAENELWAFSLAEIYFSQGATDEAITYYEKASRFAPGWSDPYIKLGNAYLNKADYEKAEKAYQRFLKLEPKSTRAADVKKILEDLERLKK
jgi:tetratricopeptide (TPR) repeat protein